MALRGIYCLVPTVPITSDVLIAGSSAGGGDEDESAIACYSCWWSFGRKRRTDVAGLRCGQAGVSAGAPAGWKTWGTLRTWKVARPCEFSGAPVQQTEQQQQL